jgi:hypothetical protein
MRTVARASFAPSGADWDAVERDYRAGVQSVRAIAAHHGCSESAVRKKAAQGGWIKGEPYAIRARAIQKADDASVPKYLEPSAERVEALAQVGADILIRHRTQAATLAGMVGKLAGQLDQQIDFEPELAEQIEDFFSAKAAKNPLMAGVYKQQCNSALHAIGLNARSKTMVNLTTAVANLTKIERQAWNLDEATDNRSYEDLLAELAAKTAKAA